MPATPTRSSWLFPPRTREVQLDEMWSFVGKKQKNCDPADPADDHKADWWDHVAYDPEHKLVLAVVPGARVTESVEEVVEASMDRLQGRPPGLMTSDEYAPYQTVIEAAFSRPVEPSRGPAGPGRPRLLPERRLDPGVAYATVRKEREKGRVVAVHRTVVLGTREAVDRALEGSACSRAINTSFVERQHGTARGQNARQSRRTYRFSKDWRVHESMSYFTRYRYNFCWPVRTLRTRGADGRWQMRTPAMSAGWADHIWSIEEWLSFPVVQRN
jgi:IS1 family transposase